MNHQLSGTQYLYEMNAATPPVLTVDPGDQITFDCIDCFGGLLVREDMKLDELDPNAVNPAVGPVYVRGAQPGDALKLEIQRIELAPQGALGSAPGDGPFADLIDHEEFKFIPVEGDRVRFGPDLLLPANKMIGVIGVAPREGGVSCGTPDSHGGNLDCTKITEGATLYLPVFHPGALLSVGDVHAAMGDGEVIVTGVEISARVTLRVHVVKGAGIQNPMLEDPEKVYTLASHEELGLAVKQCARDMLEVVCRAREMGRNEAGMLMSVVGNAEICQVVNPKHTARFSMPRELIGELFPEE